MTASVVSDLRGRLETATATALGLNKRLVLFGHDDCGRAAEQVLDFVAATMNARVVETLLVAVASAGTFGFRLSDGSSIFLKIHAGELTREQLEAVHDVQEILRQRGIPAARRLRPLAEFGDGFLASVHAFRDRGERLRAAHPGVVEAAAVALAKLDAAAPDIPESFPRLFGRKRNPIFRRAASGPEPPEYQDATRALGLLIAAREHVLAIDDDPVVSHGDWSARNLRFARGQVSSIFDFEAMRVAPRALSLGMSAVQFVNERWGVPNPADAAVRFIESYAKEAGRGTVEAKAEIVDLGAAYAVARYLRSTVRSGNLKDEEAPDVYRIFMGKFRQRFGRDYTPRL